VEGGAQPTAVDDAYDFSSLEANILKAIEHLTHNLSQLRAGGRFNPDNLEVLKVKPIKGSNETARLSDLAQVVPRGRVISVIVGEEGHVKPVSTAILESNLNLVPQGPSPEQPTTLTINAPPPTRESRQKAIDEAGKAADRAYAEIKEARGSNQKKLRSMQVARTVRPDDLQKTHKLMEDIVKRGNEEVKRILDGAKKVLEG
jgi:ribosome recycling factor